MSKHAFDEGDWLTRTLADARAEVATWPEWRRRAYRVLEEPNMEATMTTEQDFDGVTAVVTR